VETPLFHSLSSGGRFKRIRLTEPGSLSSIRSSYGAQVPEGTGPVAGLHSSEQKLNPISGLNVLHLRAVYFMENNLKAIGMIRGMGLFGNAMLPDVKMPMIATRDVGDYAAQRLLHLDFSGKTNPRVAWRARPVDDGS
jgi:hypothetical protein